MVPSQGSHAAFASDLCPEEGSHRRDAPACLKMTTTSERIVLDSEPCLVATWLF